MTLFDSVSKWLNLNEKGSYLGLGRVDLSEFGDPGDEPKYSQYLGLIETANLTVEQLRQHVARLLRARSRLRRQRDLPPNDKLFERQRVVQLLRRVQPESSVSPNAV